MFFLLFTNQIFLSDVCIVIIDVQFFVLKFSQNNLLHDGGIIWEIESFAFLPISFIHADT